MSTHLPKLYWRISAGLLLLLAILGICFVLITRYVERDYFDEVNQRLYGSLADTTVKVVQPLVGGEVDTLAIKDIMHSLMVINPSVEVYLLDSEGGIITYMAQKKQVKLERVSLEPLQTFIKAGEQKPFIKGDDPRNPGQCKVFSAAPILEGEDLLGYLYIILASEEQTAVTSSLIKSYNLRLGSTLFFITLAGAMLIGLVAIWLLTRNIRNTLKVVRRFKEGDYQARIPDHQLADLEPLGETFNDMADTLVANIEELKSVETLRRELIANVSHDLRTPLAVIQGYVETLMMKEADLSAGERRQMLATTLKGTENLEQLIAQLFEYAKLEAKQISPEKEAFFISDLAQDIMQQYKVLADERDIKLQFDLPEELPLVFADISMVERILQNLLDNALKFTPAGGDVKLALKADDEKVHISIADSGPGIPEAEQSHIFDRYYKQEPNKKSNKGAGLGLAIVQKMLELHDAKITVSSRLNEGATFAFDLPRHGVALA